MKNTMNTTQQPPELWSCQEAAHTYTAPDGSIWHDEFEYEYAIGKIGLDLLDEPEPEPELSPEDEFWAAVAAARDEGEMLLAEARAEDPEANAWSPDEDGPDYDDEPAEWCGFSSSAGGRRIYA